MKKITLYIQGMHCSACEYKIEDALSHTDGVDHVKADINSSSVTLSYDEKKISQTDIEQILDQIGYSTGFEHESTTHNFPKKHSILQLVGILVILLGIYILISHTIGFNFIPEIEPGAGLGIIFVIGLMTSLHCLSMCGGINLSQNMSSQAHGFKAKVLPGLKYNAGRVLSYTIIGGIVGLIGQIIRFSGTFYGVIMFIASILMVMMGLNMLGLKWVAHLKIHLPKKLVRKASELNSGGKPFIVGLLNGLMPCGPLQSMQLYALSTGSFILGALSMMAFALGTVPLMFLLGAISTLINTRFTKIMGQVSAILIIFIGFTMFGRGLGLTGMTLPFPVDSAQTQNTAILSNDTQEISTTFSSRRYAPITVIQDVPVIWTIYIDEDDINGCNNPLVIPEFGIEKRLVAGDNIITFTPSRSGVFTYSCWMGMIRSTITVIGANDDSSVNISEGSGTISDIDQDEGFAIPDNEYIDQDSIDLCDLEFGCH